MDMPGFGFSDKPKTHNYTIGSQADMQLALLETLGVQECHLLAHDYGVSVAQELLARQNAGTLKPGFQSCLFLNGGLFHGIHRPLVIQKLLASRLGFLLSPFIGKSAINRSMKRIFSAYTQPDDWEIDQLWQLIAHQNGQRISHRLIRYMHERKTYYQRWLAALTEATIPLKLVIGADDPISGSHLADAYRQLIPNPDTAVLAKTGHYPQLENPQGVLDSAFPFWEKQAIETQCHENER